MREIDGGVRFCPGCPIAGKAEGSGLSVYGVDMRSRFDRTTVLSRQLIVTDEDGGKSLAISGNPQYTPEGDFKRLQDAVADCDQPEIGFVERRTATWPFGHVEQVETLACQALKRFRQD